MLAEYLWKVAMSVRVGRKRETRPVFYAPEAFNRMRSGFVNPGSRFDS
jgi:hypothetical protein